MYPGPRVSYWDRFEFFRKFANECAVRYTEATFTPRDENTMRLLDQENTTLEDAGFLDDDSILAEIRSRYYGSTTRPPNI